MHSVGASPQRDGTLHWAQSGEGCGSRPGRGRSDVLTGLWGDDPYDSQWSKKKRPKHLHQPLRCQTQRLCCLCCLCSFAGCILLVQSINGEPHMWAPRTTECGVLADTQGHAGSTLCSYKRQLLLGPLGSMGVTGADGKLPVEAPRHRAPHKY